MYFLLFVCICIDNITQNVFVQNLRKNFSPERFCVTLSPFNHYNITYEHIFSLDLQK